MKLFVGVNRLLRLQPVDNNALDLPSVWFTSLVRQKQCQSKPTSVGRNRKRLESKKRQKNRQRISTYPDGKNKKIL
jgi:hypothetical protein